MASSYDNDLRLNEMATGDQSGAWGTVTNLNLEMIAEAFSYGTRAIANASTDNITLADGALDADRSMYLKLTGGGQACTVTFLPATISKVWLIENATSYTLTMKQGSSPAGIAIPAGQVKMIATDGGGSTNGVVYDLFTDVNFAGTTHFDNIDVDGTTNLDAVDIDGAVQIDATVNVGVDDTGYDVKFFGDTASAYMQWDASADDLILGGAAGLVVPQDKLTIASTAVTSTAAELNQLDAITRGSILYGNASGETARLAKGSAGTVLTSDGTDLSWAEGGAAFGGAAFAYSSSTTLGSSQLNAFIGITSANVVLTLPTPAVGSYYIIKYIPTSGLGYVKPSGTNTIDGFNTAITLNATSSTNLIILAKSNTAWESIGYTNVSSTTASTAVTSATYNKPSYVSAILACVGGCTADGDSTGARGGNHGGYYVCGGVGGQGYSEKLLTGSSYSYTIGAAGSTTATTFDSISVSASTISTGGGNGGVGSGGSFNATGGAGGALNAGSVASNMGVGPSGGAATRAGNGGAGYDGGNTNGLNGGGGGTGGNAGSQTVPGAAATSEASGVVGVTGQTGITFNAGGVDGATGGGAAGGASAETTITMFTGGTLTIAEGVQRVSAYSNYFGQATGAQTKLAGYVTILEFI